MGKNKLPVFTKWMLDGMFVFGILACIGTPYVLHYMENDYKVCKEYFWPVCICIMISGVLGLMILWELKKMFSTVIQEDPFILANVTSLKRMGILSFLIVIAVGILFFYFFKPTFFLMMVVFLVAGLFSLVLSQVFQRAIEYKIENDFTI